MRTHYEILKVAEDAPEEVIKAAYRVLSQKHHPDKNGGNQESLQVMQMINAAYAVLSDAAKRREYDAALRRRRQSEREDHANKSTSQNRSERASNSDGSDAYRPGKDPGSRKSDDDLLYNLIKAAADVLKTAFGAIWIFAGKPLKGLCFKMHRHISCLISKLEIRKSLRMIFGRLSQLLKRAKQVFRPKKWLDSVIKFFGISRNSFRWGMLIVSSVYGPILLISSDDRMSFGFSIKVESRWLASGFVIYWALISLRLINIGMSVHAIFLIFTLSAVFSTAMYIVFLFEQWILVALYGLLVFTIPCFNAQEGGVEFRRLERIGGIAGFSLLVFVLCSAAFLYFFDSARGIWWNRWVNEIDGVR